MLYGVHGQSNRFSMYYYMPDVASIAKLLVAQPQTPTLKRQGAIQILAASAVPMERTGQNGMTFSTHQSSLRDVSLLENSLLIYIFGEERLVSKNNFQRTFEIQPDTM